MKNNGLLAKLALPALVLLAGCSTNYQNSDSSETPKEYPVVSGIVCSETRQRYGLLGNVKQSYEFTVVTDEKEIYTFGVWGNHRAVDSQIKKGDHVEIQLTDHYSSFEPDNILISYTDIKKVNDEDNQYYKDR